MDKNPAKPQQSQDKNLDVPSISPDAPLKIEEELVEEPPEKPDVRLFVAGIVILIITIVISASILIFSLRTGPEEEVSEVATVSEEAKTEEETTLSRAEIIFEVLNGSGITGLAQKGADKLETLGYQIGKVGNASSVTENELYLSEDIMDKSSLILKDLKTDFNISSVSGELKEASSSARIILGEE
jgi:hypothetical protein